MMDFLSKNGLAFAALIAGFGFIIFVHELGHFLVAKWVGIKVTQFAIGFAHAIVSYRRGIGLRLGTTERAYERRLEEGADPQTMGETEYRLNWLPFGGYVKMVGQEDIGPAATSDDPRAFGNKPIWARACVVSAGVIMNVVFAVVFFVICFLWGVDFPPSVVGDVRPTGAAAQIYAVGHENDPAYFGIQPGDRVVAIDGDPVNEFMEIAVHTALARRNDILELEIKRDGETERLKYRITPREDRTTHLLSLGLLAPYSNLLQFVPTEGPFGYIHEQGVRPEMVVTNVAGRPVTTYGQYHRLVAEGRGLPTPVTFTDEQKGKSVTVDIAAKASLVTPKDGSTNLIGLVPVVKIVSVLKDSAAAKTGIRPGDYLSLVGSTIWPSSDQVSTTVRGAEGRKLKLAVWRNGAQVELEPTAPGRNKQLGIAMLYDEAIVSHTRPQSPVAGLNLVAGSRIVSVAGKPVTTWSDVQRELQIATEHSGDKARITIGFELATVGLPREEAEVVLNAGQIRELAQARWQPDLPSGNFADLRHTVKAVGAIEAANLGVWKTHHFMLQTYVTLIRLFQGTVPVKELRGPVGIAHIGTRVARQGWPYLLFFLGLISVNLAVINFLPIPIVDGGLMVFLIIEKLKGSPVSPRIQTAAVVIGLALLGSILLLTLYYDTTRLINPG